MRANALRCSRGPGDGAYSKDQFVDLEIIKTDHGRASRQPTAHSSHASTKSLYHIGVSLSLFVFPAAAVHKTHDDLAVSVFVVPLLL